MEVIWAIALIALLYFGYQALKAKKKIDTIYRHLAKPLSDYYFECKSKDEQHKMSWFVIAAHLQCMPDEILHTYHAYLSDMNFTKSELLEVKQIWALKKYDEAKQLHIDFDITPAAVMENLTSQYISKN
jgi:hypothetical protein